MTEKTPIFGITWFAQDALGEIVYAQLPEAWAPTSRPARPTPASSSRSKRSSDLYSPLTGEVVEINDALQDEPQRVNEDCYGDGWLIRVRMTAPGEFGKHGRGGLQEVPRRGLTAVTPTPYIPHSAGDVEEMLGISVVGASSVDDLFCKILRRYAGGGAAGAARRPQ